MAEARYFPELVNPLLRAIEGQHGLETECDKVAKAIVDMSQFQICILHADIAICIKDRAVMALVMGMIAGIVEKLEEK